MFNRKLASTLALTAMIAALSAIPASAAEPAAAAFKSAEVSIGSATEVDAGSPSKKALHSDVKFVRKVNLNGTQKIGSDSVAITITPKGK